MLIKSTLAPTVVRNMSVIETINNYNHITNCPMPAAEQYFAELFARTAALEIMQEQVEFDVAALVLYSGREI
jgi:hypothetical protein